jgi:excisionase family DNA binding protein
MPDELLSVPQAAEVLGCSRSTVDLMIRDGRLPAVNLPPAYRRKGIRRYVRREDVERLKETFTGRPGRRPRPKE